MISKRSRKRAGGQQPQTTLSATVMIITLFSSLLLLFCCCCSTVFADESELRRVLSNNMFLQPDHQVQYGDLRNKYRIDDETLQWNDNNSTNTTNIEHNNDKKNKEPQPRIINGVLAPENRYPYVASLQFNSQHFCGGTLVSPNMVITAAHCTSTPATITLGRYDLDSNTDYDYEVMNVFGKIIHPEYNEAIVEHDVALLVLERDSIHPYVILNDNDNVPMDGEGLVVMGWGDIDSSDSGQETSDRLRETDVWYLPNSECELSEGYVKTNGDVLFGSYAGSIRESMLCAHDWVGTTSDACQGDSGGGLVKPGSSSSADVLVGLVSWGFGCADPNFPGVYSRLSHYYESFLKPAICEHSQSPPSYLNCPNSFWSTSPPTPAPIPAGLLTVVIGTDPNTPEDLGWEISSIPDGNVIASRPIGYYANQYEKSLSEEVIVDPENFYRLTVYDRDRDGFKGQIAVVQGKVLVSFYKSDALVYEPGFSAVSGASVSHGFYVGDSPPRELILSMTFDTHPEHIAWSITNVEDDIPLSFRWFDWYGNEGSGVRATEKIPIYGNDRGKQQYVFTILDLEGNGMCCSKGQGYFSLYLGELSSDNLIVTGGEFTNEQTVMFDVDSIGATLSAPAEEDKPTQQDNTNSQPGYFMSSSTGICQVNDESKPAWVTLIYDDYDECCAASWNKEPCYSAKPTEAFDMPSPTANDVQSTADNQPYSDNEFIDILDTHGSFTHTPVTGSFTCKAAGLTCTISCDQCGSIKRVASAMTMENPNKSTIIYTAERGTDEYPDEPSRLILVESDTSAANAISCDEGCTCDSVNDSVLGCGLIAKPTSQQPVDSSPMQPSEYVSSCSSHGVSPIYLISMIIVWTILR